MPVPAVVAGAAKAAPYVMSGLSMLFGRPKKKADIGKTLAKYLSMRADGYVTDEDKAAASRATQRVGRQAGSQRRADTESATNRLSRQGLLGSGLNERVIQQIADREALGLENAGLAGADVEYQAYGRNKGFQENKIYQAMSAETRAAEAQAARDDLSTSTFWNSTLDLASQLGSYYSPQTAAVPAKSPLTPAPAAPAGSSSLAVPALRSEGGRPALRTSPAPPRVGGRIASRLARNAGTFAYAG